MVLHFESLLQIYHPIDVIPVSRSGEGTCRHLSGSIGNACTNIPHLLPSVKHTPKFGQNFDMISELSGLTYSSVASIIS